MKSFFSNLSASCTMEIPNQNHNKIFISTILSPRSMSPCQPPVFLRGKSGFTLIELLVVIAIISIIATMTVPALKGSLDAVSLAGAGEVVTTSLNLARQTAMSRNVPVEVRIYKEDDGISSPPYRKIQLVIPAGTNGSANEEPLGKAKLLPGQMILDSTAGKDFSTVLTAAGMDAPSGTGTGPHKVFKFRPDGSTDLDEGAGTPWSLTIKNPNHLATDAGLPASNFITVVIDPLTGRTVVYHP